MAHMATETPRLRADDVPNIPIDDPASTGWELVDGELVAIMGANSTHAWLTVEVAALMREYVRAQGIGEVFGDLWCKLGVPRDPEQLRAPDAAYLSAEKRARLRTNDFLRGAPDIAVEIFSPTNNRKRGDFQLRIRDFVDAGTPLLWVIYPDARYAMVHRADGSAHMVRETEALEGEDVLPGFRLELRELFDAMP